MNILVTGGAGYKGVLLAKKLLERGHSVTILDNFMFRYDCVLHLVKEPQLSIKQMDIRNLQERDVAGFDVIYHLAGISGMPACAANPHAAEMINVHGTATLCGYLHKDQLIVYASTTSFYGAGGQACDETVDVKPVSIYGRTKYEAERIVLQHENAVALRFATVFGVSPKMRVDLMVNDFAYKAVKDRAVVLFAAHSKRTFIHIDDAIAAYLFALDHSTTMRGQAYNVGAEHLNYSKLDIARAIEERHPFEVIDSSLPDLDQRDFLVSFKKLTELGFRVRLGLAEGIHDLLKLYSFYTKHSNAIL
jgi:nucleoside-diphosphate-sugar epimerase